MFQNAEVCLLYIYKYQNKLYISFCCWYKTNIEKIKVLSNRIYLTELLHYISISSL